MTMHILANPDENARCVMVMADFQVPTYLKSFDLEADKGIGAITVTTEIAEAMVFENGHQLIETWRRPSQAVPIRWDGKPNRPLTAFSIAIRPAPASVSLLPGFELWSGGYPGLESGAYSHAG